ncbi:MAG TPA: hypothetical protein VLJ60_07170 [bacterium]|nr:hypothetical protein [bacterium]
MKKLLLAMVLVTLALFAVSCGSEESESCTDGEKKCSGEVFAWCVDGVWVEKDCETDGKVCDDTKGCIAEGGDTGDTGNTGNTGDTGDTGDTGNTGNSGDSGNTGNSGNSGDSGNTGDSAPGDCEDIFMCMNGCGENDDACLQACYDAGTAAGKSEYDSWQTCFSAACSSDTTAQCSVDNCPTESAKCGIKVGGTGDPSYKTPYGSANLNGNFTYILTNEAKLEQNMIIMDYFATGSLGNGTIAATGAQGAYSYAMYYEDATNGNGFQIVQTPYTGDGATSLNPVAFFVVPSDVAPGSISVGLTAEDVGQFFVVDTTSDGKIACFHAIGVGTVTINSANPSPAAAGNISFTGTAIELNSPKNIPIYGGDISADLGVTACAPR